MKALAGILLALLLAGCATTSRPQYRHAPGADRIDSIVLCADVGDARYYWEAEVRRHGITDCVIVICHGTEWMGMWMAFPDAPMKMITVEQLLWTIRREHPGRDLIAVICNPTGLPLTVPDVYYAREDVWERPADRWQMTRRGMDHAAGCLDNFQCTRSKGCESR
jgi:hypothetical protein